MPLRTRAIRASTRSANANPYPISLYFDYPLAKYKWGSQDRMIEVLAKKFGGIETGGGTGFGYRTVDLAFKTTEDATAFLKVAEKTWEGTQHFLSEPPSDE